MIICLKKNLYPKRAINKAAEVYKDLAKFTISEKDGYYLTELSQIDKDVKAIIKDEFCNYIISEIKS